MQVHYHVVAAIIQHKGKILCTQKGPGKYDYISYKYEFPGGKVEVGETVQAALHREIKEEIRLDIAVGERYKTIEHQYPHFNITLEAFLCSASDISPLQLTEHINHQWRSPNELPLLDWAAADLPIVAALAGTFAQPH